MVFPNPILPKQCVRFKVARPSMNNLIEAVLAGARFLPVLALAVACGTGFAAQGGDASAVDYQIYTGSTHAHTAYTWSHGEQWAKSPTPRMQVKNSTSYPSSNNVPKSNWQKYQGPPASCF